ncbi:hypothetical protein [Janibacter sp. GS2]|uniref:hypothetical protein n=1 Tax=Janibacter sp. GS2 TaxID=3442646 RepID=UPI003EB84C50
MISGTVVSLLVVVAGILAVRAEGEPVHDVALTDGSIWVSGGRTGYWGRVNTGSHALDTIIDGAGRTPATKATEEVARADILQDGRHAVGITGVADGTTQDRQLVAFDTTTGTPITGNATLPASQITTGDAYFMPDLVALGGNTLAVVDHASGDLWAMRLDPEGGTAIDGLTDRAPLESRIGRAAAVTVSEDGDIMVVSAESGTVVEVPAQGEGFGRAERTDLPFEGSRLADITAVGDRWVVLDLEEATVHAEGMERPRPLPGGGSEQGGDLAIAALQQAGPESLSVAVQTIERAEYVEIDEGATSGSDAGISSGLDGKGERAQFIKVSRPVLNGDCLYAAWGRGNGVLWGSACGEAGAGVSEIGIVGDLARRSGVVVRRNRGQVILNDLDTGRIFDLAVTVDPRIDTWPGGAPRAEPAPYVPDYKKRQGQPPSSTSAPTKPSTTSG